MALNDKKIDRRNKLRVTVYGNKEDLLLLKLLAKAHRTSQGDLLSRVWSLFCRTLRTSRNPATGEPILWEAAKYGPIPSELQEYLGEAERLLKK